MVKLLKLDDLLDYGYKEITLRFFLSRNDPNDYLIPPAIFEILHRTDLYTQLPPAICTNPSSSDNEECSTIHGIERLRKNNTDPDAKCGLCDHFFEAIFRNDAEEYRQADEDLYCAVQANILALPAFYQNYMLGDVVFLEIEEEMFYRLNSYAKELMANEVDLIFIDIVFSKNFGGFVKSPCYIDFVETDAFKDFSFDPGPKIVLDLSRICFDYEKGVQLGVEYTGNYLEKLSDQHTEEYVGYIHYLETIKDRKFKDLVLPNLDRLIPKKQIWPNKL